MSAFVVSRRTMDRCVHGILNSGEYKFAGESLRLDTPADRRRVGQVIGRALYDMNVRAVMQRYPDCVDDPTSMPGPDGAADLPAAYVPTPPTSKTWGVHNTLKALVCLRYQCSEGDIPNSDLWRELDSFIGRIALNLVSRHPAWEASLWD
jgi:hypothetical protein